MVFVDPLTDEERTALLRLTRQAVGRVSQRAYMILLSAQHRSVAEIAAIFGVSHATVGSEFGSILQQALLDLLILHAVVGHFPRCCYAPIRTHAGTLPYQRCLSVDLLFFPGLVERIWLYLKNTLVCFRFPGAFN